MKRLALVLLMLAIILPGSLNLAAAATQPGASLTPEPTSGPVTAGGWTFQVVEQERRHSC